MRHQTTTPHLKSCATGSIAAVAGCNGSHGGGGGLDKVGVLRPGERQDVNASCKIPQRESRGRRGKCHSQKFSIVVGCKQGELLNG